MEQTVRQCNIRITARYTSNFFFLYLIYIYIIIYFSLVCASCAFHEDFRLDRSFDFCEKRRYRARFVHFVSVRNIFFFWFRFSVFSGFFFRFFFLSFFLRPFKPSPHAGRVYACMCVYARGREHVAHLAPRWPLNPRDKV